MGNEDTTIPSALNFDAETDRFRNSERYERRLETNVRRGYAEGPETLDQSRKPGPRCDRSQLPSVVDHENQPPRHPNLPAAIVRKEF